MATSRRKKKDAPLPEPEPIGWRARLVQSVKAVTVQPPQTRDELVKYYEKMYPGLMTRNGRVFPAWEDHLVTDLMDLTGLSRPSLLRRFQKRGNKDWWEIAPSARAAAQYKLLGDKIGPKPPRFGYHVSFDGWLSFSELCEKRSFEVDVVGSWTMEIAKNPILILDAMLLIYLQEDDQSRPLSEQDQPSAGICERGDKTDDPEKPAKDPVIVVTKNRRKVASGHSGRARRFSFFDRR